MFVTFLEFIQVYPTDGQFAQPFWNATEKCNRYYDHRSIWWFCNFKTSCYGKTIHSLTQECTKPKGQKVSLSWYSCSEYDQTYTYSTKGFHLEFEVLLFGTLGSSFTEPTTEGFFLLPTPHGLNELAFSKHSWSLLLFCRGFTSFAQNVRELEPIPKIILMYFFYLLHNFESKNCLPLRLLYISLRNFRIVSQSFNKVTSKFCSDK